MKFSTDIVKEMNKKGILSNKFVKEMESIKSELQKEEPIKNDFIELNIDEEEEMER